MKYRKIILAITIAVVIIFSCNKSRLDQPPLGQLDETALANKHGVEGLLIGAYALLDGVSVDDSYDPILGRWVAVEGFSPPARQTGSMEVFVAVKRTRVLIEADQIEIHSMEIFNVDAND